MNSVIVQAETLNLPAMFAVKLAGKKVEIVESGDSIIITPVKCPIESIRGMFESDGHAVDRYLQRKRVEKEREYANEVRF